MRDLSESPPLYRNKKEKNEIVVFNHNTALSESIFEKNKYIRRCGYIPIAS